MLSFTWNGVLFLVITVFLKLGACIKDGDCVGPTDSVTFSVTPGGYDPHGEMSPELCKTRCAEVQQQYAGITGKKKYCMCSDDPFAEKLTPSRAEVCENEHFGTIFYHSDLFTPISGLRVVPSSSIVNVGEEVHFYVLTKSGSNAEVLFNFGDGTAGTVNNLKFEPKYVFFQPGTYKVTVTAKPVGAPDTYIKSAEVLVTVTNPPSEESLEWTCPFLVQPFFSFRCNLTVYAGADMVMDIDPGDGTRHFTVKLPDVRPQYLGVKVPQYWNRDVIVEKDNGADSAVLPETRVTREAKLTVIEAYGSVAGTLDILILRPTCIGCVYLDNNYTCTEKTKLCSHAITCLNKDRCPKRSVFSIYKVIENIPIEVSQGYFYRNLSTPLMLHPGDVLGYSSSGGRIAHRRVEHHEEPDMIKKTPIKGQAVRTDDMLSKNHKFLIQFHLFVPVKMSFEYKYSDAGAYEVSIDVRNRYHETSVRKMADVSSQEKLTSFRLEVSNNQVATGTEVEISARMAGGSDVTMQWDFGDGTTTTESVTSVEPGQKFFKTHVYNDPGTYVVHVNSSNMHGSFIARRSIVVQAPVTEAWEIFTNEPIILPEQLFVTLTYPKTERLPTNATVRILYGDKDKGKWRIPSESEERISQRFVHSYTKPGIYNVVLNISNLISHQVLRAKVEAAIRITGLSVKVQFKPSEKEPPRSGLGPNADIFLTTRPVMFSVDVETGKVEEYILETAKGQLLANGTGKLKKYKLEFPEPGQYDVFVYAWNHVQHRTEPVILGFRVMEPIIGLDVYMNETTPKDEHIRNLMISFDLPGTDSCLMVNFGDGTDTRAYGSKDQCLTRYRPDQFLHEGPLDNPLFLTNIYERGYDYMFNLWVFNDISEEYHTFNFTVNNEPCRPPEINIRNQVFGAENATWFYRLNPIEIYTITVVECNISIDVTRRWEAYMLNETEDIVGQIDLTVLDAHTKSMLYVPEFFFEPGVYKLRYNVNMSAPRAKPPMFHQRFAETYIKVRPSPIKPQMIDGAQSRVTRGFPQTLTLDPGNYSINPDDLADKNFSITWYCRRVSDDENINRDIPDEKQNMTSPLWHRLDQLDKIKAAGNDFNVSEFLASEEMEDNGGCFGQGPGRINIEGSSVEWSTILFYKPNVTYEMLAKIKKWDRPASWGAIQVVLMEQVPPSIKVECQTEKLCYPYEPIGQKINPVRVGLIGLCEENCDGELIFDWQIFGSDNGTEVFLEDAREYLVGATEQKMALSDDFFKVYYPLFGDFIAKLTVTNQYGVSGVSDIFLHINKPPENGFCTFSPEDGRALLDKFSASCKDWTDPEGKEIEFFAYWVRSLSNDALTFLTYGPDSDVTLYLPYGDFQAGADVKDKEGATTRVNMTVVSTSLPTKQEFERYLNDRSLDNADAAGDQAKMNQMSQAISSLMNVRLPDEYENEINYSDPAVLDREMEEQALLRSKMVRSVSSIMNVDTLNSLEQVGSALTAIAGEGNGVDNEGKQIIIKLLNKTVQLASTLKVEAPQQLLDFCMYAVGTMGGIVARMTQQLIEGVVMPTDRSKATSIEYDAEIALEGEEEKENIFDGTIPIEVALQKAVVMEERKSAEQQITTMVDLTIRLVLAILRNIVVGEKPLEFISPSGLGLTISMFSGGGLSHRRIQHGEALYVFPHVCDILTWKSSCAGNETLGVMAVSWPAILQSYGESVDVLSNDTKTLQLVLLNENLERIDVTNTTEYFGIIIPRKSGNQEGGLPDPNPVHPTIKWNEQMIYHQFVVEKPDSAVNIEVTPGDPEVPLLVYIMHREKPLLNHYDLMVNLSTIRSINGTYDIFLSNDVVNNRTGFFYLGLVEANGSIPYFNMDEPVNLTDSSVLREFSTNYSIRIYTSGCYFFNPSTKLWSGEGCYVEDANYALTHCKCNHLTSFGGGFFVMPNTIDFAYVFANAGFADNITIYMTVIVTMLLYLVLVIWARYQDKKDVEKLGATPLPDNDMKDKYLYEISVFTGEKEGAGTDSTVHFILSGDDDETEVRTFGDPKRKIFRRGAIDTFVMTVSRPLGRLNYMRVWHDNSGKGKFRSWHLRFISVRDVQTNARFDFIANKWFAVEKDDGMIDRLIPVAGKDEATEFSHLFQLKTQKNLADGHLWFSIFMRPPKSRFTRVQRVSCCVALLYLSMLVNAMWYGQVPSKPSASALNVGPLSLSPEQVGVGFLANLIIFPPTFLMITLFRKSKLRKKRPNRITQALKQKRDSVIVSRSTTPNPLKSDSTTNLMSKEKDMSDMFEQKTLSMRKSKKSKKKKFMFPWWCRYVAWALCLSSIFISVFFIWAYGVQFGDEKTRKWVTSLIISFITSILITQPLKVFMVAIILSSLFKSPDKDEDDADEDEEEPELLGNEEWLHTGSSAKGERRKQKYRPPNTAEMERAKEERLREIKMNAILKEIFSYLFFLWILTVLSYGNRDPNAYFLQMNLKNQFIKNGDFNSITSAEQFYKWTRDVMVPNLKVSPWYNGQQPYGLRGFLEDRVNRIMGFGFLRQVRAKPNSCKVEKLMKKVVDSCRGQSSLINEDKKSYTSGWAEQVDDKHVDEWHYQSARKLQGLPFWGKLDVYGGGGFMVPIRGPKDKIIEKINYLEKSNWIDGGTRAVFAEFSVYNAQANLFGVVTMVAEFHPGGGVVPNARIDPIRLMRYHQGFGLFVLLCEITFVGFIIYFTVREVKSFRNLRSDYFKSYWNVAEVVALGLSYSAMFFYISRMVATHKILKTFERSHGNAFVKLQMVATIDEVFGYLMSFLIFICILKFTKLLRFNKRIGVLYSTLTQCSRDLSSFFVVFWVIFFAFVQVFYVTLGTVMQEFSTFVTAAETSFDMMRGQFKFDDIVMASPFIGPFVFFVFALITSIILLNLFVTLIISSFQAVKADIDKQCNDFEIVSFMGKKIKGFFGMQNQVNPEQPPTLESQITNFPEKVDRLLYYINDMYFDGQLNLNNKKALKALYKAPSQEQEEPQATMLDWGEVPDEQSTQEVGRPETRRRRRY